MRWFSTSTPGIWLMPATAGVLLILTGLLLYAHPEFLAYFVAAVFVISGAALLGVAWKLRTSVSYRRLDDTWQADDPDEP